MGQAVQSTCQKEAEGYRYAASRNLYLHPLILKAEEAVGSKYVNPLVKDIITCGEYDKLAQSE